MSLVAYGESSESENEDSVDKTHKADKGGQDVRKLLSVLPNPSKGKQQPVRLAMPSLKHHKRVSFNNPSDFTLTLWVVRGAQMILTVMMTLLQ